MLLLADPRHATGYGAFWAAAGWATCTARLIDGGIAPACLPYFAMEYVEGLPLPMYCSEHCPGVDERLRLFGLAGHVGERPWRKTLKSRSYRRHQWKQVVEFVRDCSQNYDTHGESAQILLVLQSTIKRDKRFELAVRSSKQLTVE